MTMTLEKSQQWLALNEHRHIEALRAKLGGVLNEAAIDAMVAIYREGWNDCFRNARLNGVKRGFD